jgi:hypothetical protein
MAARASNTRSVPAPPLPRHAGRAMSAPAAVDWRCGRVAALRARGWSASRQAMGVERIAPGCAQAGGAHRARRWGWSAGRRMGPTCAAEREREAGRSSPSRAHGRACAQPALPRPAPRSARRISRACVRSRAWAGRTAAPGGGREQDLGPGGPAGHVADDALAVRRNHQPAPRSESARPNTSTNRPAPTPQRTGPPQHLNEPARPNTPTNRPAPTPQRSGPPQHPTLQSPPRRPRRVRACGMACLLGLGRYVWYAAITTWTRA